MAQREQEKEQELLDHARDELFSHIVRCNVLEAAEEHQDEWLDETLEYMADRYPDLSHLQLAQLRMLGKRYLAPPIPHGRGWNALTMERRLAEQAEGAATSTAEPAPAEAAVAEPTSESLETSESEERDAA